MPSLLNKTAHGGALVAALLTAACSPPPPKPVVSEPKPPPSVVEEAPKPVATAQPVAFPEDVPNCGQDYKTELPVALGTIGDGERVVRLINNSLVDVQARLLDHELKSVFEGTLRVPAGKTGEFQVDEGVYYVRYRLAKTCEVRRGSKLVLTGKRAGVEISIKPKFARGTKSNMRPVSEPL